MAEPVLTVGVVADTHIPDRVRMMHPCVISSLAQANVNLILHAGDISSHGVLEELGRVAPVQAVRGNRDWLFVKTLPLILNLELAGVPLALMHGHGGMLNYLVDKYLYLRDGYDFARYQKKLVKSAAQAKVIVFGHTHRSVNTIIDGRLLFNPGSANFGNNREILPSIGLLRFFVGGEVRGEILKLSGFRLKDGVWQSTGDS
jgi:putative phosphoesterase